MKVKLVKVAPAWHAEAAEILKANFDKINQLFLDSTNKAVWLGLFLNYIKARGKEDKSIPHGQFEKWREQYVPSIARSQLSVYMSLGRNAAEKAQFQISGFRTFASSGELPPAVEKLVDGKTQNQLFLEFKQSEDDEDGEGSPKRGNLKSKGRSPKNVSPEAALEAQRKIAREDVDATYESVTALGAKWVILPPGAKEDEMRLTSLLAAFEQQSKALRTWLNKPVAKRDPHQIEEMFK